MINTATKPATLVGCAIGDALGVPWEMKSASNPNLQKWDGLFKDGGTFHTSSKAGQYSDDTLMTMALAKSLIECGKYEPANAAQKYLDWFNSGNPRGMGGTTRQALMRLSLGKTWEESGIQGMDVCGNGTAMRASPLGLAFRNDHRGLKEACAKDAIITHNNSECIAGSIAVAAGVSYLLRGGTPQHLVEIVYEDTPEGKVADNLDVARALIEVGEEPAKALKTIGVSGYVVHTVAAAFYCVAKNTNFKDTVIMAIKAGGDADTTAAIAGALSGTYYGIEGIPEEYKGVEDFALLNELTDKLMALGDQ